MLNMDTAFESKNNLLLIKHLYVKSHLHFCRQHYNVSETLGLVLQTI